MSQHGTYTRNKIMAFRLVNLKGRQSGSCQPSPDEQTSLPGPDNRENLSTTNGVVWF